MASCGPRASSARAALALALLLPLPIPAHAQAAAADPPEKGSPDPLERLRRARANQSVPETVRGPISVPVPTEEQRKRAFEGLRRRKPAPAIDARARSALEKAREGLAAERDAMAHRIGQALGLEAPDIKARAGTMAPPISKAWVPVLFASSSMPVQTLRAYAGQLERAGGVIAFRGMPGGLTRVAPMAKLSAEVLRVDTGCEGPACAMRGVQIIIDPLLFRQHGVTRVPALTMLPGDPTQPYCERELDNGEDSPRGVHLVFGDAALSGLLEEYARLGGKEEVRNAAARIESR